MRNSDKLAVYAGMYQRTRGDTEIVRMYATGIIDIWDEIVSAICREEGTYAIGQEEGTCISSVSVILRVFEGVNQRGQPIFSHMRYLEKRHRCTGNEIYKSVGRAHDAHLQLVKDLRLEVENFNDDVETTSRKFECTTSDLPPLKKAELITDENALDKLLQFQQMAGIESLSSLSQK